MQNSSLDLIDVTNEVGTSGKFIELARNGDLVAVSLLIQRRATMAANLTQVDAQLRACNNAASLAEFAVWCLRKKKDFRTQLKKIVGNCEARRIQICKTIAEIDRQLEGQKPSTGLEKHSVLCASLVPKVKPQTFWLEARNKIIDQNIALPNQDICKILDFELAVNDKVPPQCFPEGWAEDFGVNTFLAAYRNPKCRGKVHTLISKRRPPRRYPKA